MTEPIAVIDGVLQRTLTDSEGNTRIYFFGTIESDRVKDLTFVPVLEESPRTYLNERLEGYQRSASATRMNQFARYLKEHSLSVVPPIVISDRGAWRFQGDLVGRLDLFDAAAIIDGQHRCGGYVRHYEETEEVKPIDFILLSDLTEEEEKAEFITINNTQKGVTPALTAYLQQKDEAIIAWELNLRDDSPFKDKITRQRLQAHHLFALHSVAKNVGRTFSHGALSDANLSIDEKVDIMIRYWTIIADSHVEEWNDINSGRRDANYKLLELTGLIAWSLAAQDILGPAFSPEYRAMNWEEVEAKVKRLATSACVDWQKKGEFEGRTGEVGGAQLHRKIQWCLQQTDEGTEED